MVSWSPGRSTSGARVITSRHPWVETIARVVVTGRWETSVLRSGGSWTGIVRARGARGLWRSALGGLAGCLLLALGAAPVSAAPTDLSGGAFQILAPGAEGGLAVGKHSTDQGKLYDKLTPLRGNVTTADLEKLYVSEKFHEPHQAGDTEEFTSRAGLEIWRDKYDIPHIFGATRADVMFGSGWVAAQDRGLLLALGLGPAYAAALSVPGINAFELLLTDRSFTPSAQAINFVSEQKKVLLAKGAEGEQVLEDLEDWAEGVNAYEQTLPAYGRLPTVTVTDAIAGFAFIGSIFGNGGGSEVANSNFLAALENKLGPTEGLKVFRDLRDVNDPEAPTTTTKPFPYDQVPDGPTPGAVVIDHGSMSAPAALAVKATHASRRKASNFLLVGASHTEDGHPLAVMGPQLGYFYPEIVMQADLHGPGIDAEGVVAPISPYVFIGRGRDFAWSLTSAGSENTQQFLEKLCNPDESPPTRESDHYEYNGECIPMTTFDAGRLGAGNGEPEHEVYFKETVHGPISGTVLVHGQPYAIANDRADRGSEPAGELAFSDLDSDRVHSPEQFFEAANELETTFNMAYIDSKNIAYFSTGRLPILAPGTDSSLPTLGTGEYDWRGFLSLAQHPHELAPASDLFLNWNTKPAPEWGAASDNYSYGAVQRVQLYTGFTTGMNEASDVSIMNRAATEDLRGVKVWPVIEQVLAHSHGPSKLAERAVRMLTSWAKRGASDFGKNTSSQAGTAIMDAVWTPIAEAVLGPVLGELMPEFESISSTDNPPNSSGSSFDEGWYGYVYKDLRSELGLTVDGPYSREYCGNGSLEACRASLWAAIQKGVEQLAASFPGEEPSAWRAAPVRITFPPDPYFKFTMRWTNRSTFQQVIEFTGHEEGE
jgi:acyl-homoserine lactone acylase PvdQ